MSTHQTPVTAFALSLTAGILMLVSGIIGYLWLTGTGINYGFDGMMNGYGGMMGGFNGMMNGYQNMMSGLGVHSSYMTGFSIIGLTAGILVLIGAIMLNTRPAEHTAWGALILAFSVISFLGMGGFWIGALIGIAGGALALAWRPRSRTTNQA
jgi:hypothetical protein